MTTKFEELILEEIFKLSSKIDKIQDEMKGMATKEDIKNMATKDDIKDMATKDDIKDMATKTDLLNLEKRIDEKFEEQAKEIAMMFDDSYKLNAKYRQEMKEQITKETDIKIENLRREFLYKKA